MRLIFRIMIATAITASAPASAKRDKQLEKLIAMTPEQFAASAVVSDDDMEVVASIDTERGFKWKPGLFAAGGADIFLRAMIDKKTGAAVARIHYRVQYQENQWANLETVNIAFPSGLKSMDAERAGADVSCSGGTCTYLEYVTVPVAIGDLRDVAATYQPGADNPLRLRFKTRIGINVESNLMPAEVAGFLMRVDQYRRGKGLPSGD